LLLWLTLGIMDRPTPSGTGPSPIGYGSGYATAGDFCVLGAAFGILFLGIFCGAVSPGSGPWAWGLDPARVPDGVADVQHKEFHTASEVFMNGKITVFGAGNVGGAVTRRLIERKLCKRVVLVDRSKSKAQGIALDILEASPIDLLEPICVSGEDLEQTRDSDIVIITAGATRKEGMTRDELLKINAGIVSDCVSQAAKYSPYAFYIVVSNPLNVMCHVAMRAGQLPKTRVTGMAGILDSCRFQYFISKELGVSVENVHAMVLGEHGEDMVPIPRYSTVAGIPLPELLPQAKIDELISRTRDGGAEIIRLMRTSAFYAPASAVIQMVAAVVMDKKKILPCATYLSGEYGISGTFVGVPVKLGTNGVEEIMTIELTDEERTRLTASAAKIKEQMAILGEAC
jgi:malate dehydrogenase